jgi:hypothetical protein
MAQVSVEGPEGDNGGGTPRADGEIVDVDDPATPEAPPPPAPRAGAGLPVPYPQDDDTDAAPPPPPPPDGAAAPPPPPRQGSVATRDDRPVFLVVGAVLAVGVVAVLVVALVRTLAGDDDGQDDAVPTGPLAAIVPDIAASPVMLGPADRTALLNEMIASGRNDVATDAPTGVLCAAVALDVPLEATGRWERDGQAIASSEPSVVGPPGFGDCIDAAGERMEDGTYQFLVTDAAGAESAAATLVVGAAPIAQPFVNDADEPVCALRIAPSAAGYFEAYDFTAAPVPPGGTIALVIADVEQALRADGCGEGAAELASFEFDPDPTTTRPMAP